MLGAILGDIVGSVYEFNNIVRQTNFQFFNKDSAATDDTICTVACMDWLIHGKDPALVLRQWCNGYPAAGYGPLFYAWLTDPNADAYGSFGNGAVMRISPAALWFKNASDVYDSTIIFTGISHNHDESFKSALLLNGIIRLCVAGATKKQIADAARTYFSDKIDLSIEDLYNRAPPFFDVTAKGTLLHALICFLNTDSFEDSIRYGVSIGGDSDTVCAVIGAISEAFYGFPDEYLEPVFARLSDEMRNVVIKYYSNRAIRPIELNSDLMNVQKKYSFTNPYDYPQVITDDTETVDFPDEELK